ncbi:ABC-type nitrate/sulfonate/bicarbonate transport system permease component [Herbihabitans rhizosphaerae]|uniref:ABC-type nitrate/sulfonate/bicarbonate transport system permease component n=1 Tax=Herbihabitans rhizosphaerae TaxID=1872711 RepID=A0A4Q7KYE8_9PSEU|nr:ABC transporter permease [Herbihabitans rhizosphaerae]RZS41071.1 ABC-type nitrate/sulfonate/bicarbonate transport system permease component [Herbihabitans rhizosphaerae]
MSRVAAFAGRWLVLAGALLVWEIAARASASLYFPPITTILDQGRALWLTGDASSLWLSATVFDDILPSIGRALSGLAIAVVIGVALGTALGRSRTGMDYVGPLFAFFRAIPPPTLIPVFLVLLKIGTPMQVTTIVFGCVWPILLNTVDGVRTVDRTQTDTARAFRIPRTAWLTTVVLPAAMPKIFAGLRLSMSIAVLLMVISELVATTNGIGYQLLFAQRQFDFPKMWAWIMLLGVIGYGLNTALLAVEGRTLRWQPSRQDLARLS